MCSLSLSLISCAARLTKQALSPRWTRNTHSAWSCLYFLLVTKCRTWNNDGKANVTKQAQRNDGDRHDWQFDIWLSLHIKASVKVWKYDRTWQSRRKRKPNIQPTSGWIFCGKGDSFWLTIQFVFRCVIQVSIQSISYMNCKIKFAGKKLCLWKTASSIEHWIT